MFEENPRISVVADNKQSGKEQVPIHEKVTLTIKEAAEYSNIGINKIEGYLRLTEKGFIGGISSKLIFK